VAAEIRCSVRETIDGITRRIEFPPAQDMSLWKAAVDQTDNLVAADTSR
jgi:hypothetical protein